MPDLVDPSDGRRLLPREDRDRLFPLIDREGSIEFLQPLAAAALVGITTMNVLSSQGHDPMAPGAKHTVVQKFLISMPYTMFLLGVAGLTLAMIATKRRPRLLGCAAGFLLAELMYLVIVGGLVTIARSDASQWIVWPVTGVILIALLVTWSLMCAYPKFLRCSLCCADPVVDPSQSEEPCVSCGAPTVGGRSVNPAGEGAEKCESCGGIRVDIEA